MSTLAASFQLQPSPTPQPHVAQRKPHKKGGYTRQRRGCLTCRQRKKKCDQGLPICGHCSRLNLVCKHEKPRQLSSAWGEDAVEDSGVSGSQAHPYWGSQQHSVIAQGDDVSELLRLTKIAEPLDLVRPDDFVGCDWSSSRRTMMRYYTSTLAIMLSATAENNCFLSVLLPMAFDCPALLDAMAAWSSAHLALRDPSFRGTSLQYRGRVLANLSAALQEGSLSGEMCLAVAMAMCSMETISDATSSSWSHHLSGAAAVLQSKSSDVLVGPLQASPSVVSDYWLRSVERKWLVRNFAYHDILMSVSLDRRPLITGDYWMSTDDTMADPYFAFASKIMLLISEISVLNADCAEYKSSLSSDLTLEQGNLALILEESPLDCNYHTPLERAHSIANGLRDWKCPAYTANAPLALLSETYRSASLIYLDRVVRQHFPQRAAEILPEGIWAYVESVCDVAQKVPEGSLAECSLLFPLFIAGGEAKDASHIESISNRLYSMNRWRRFRNVNACREVLEEVWRKRGESKGSGRVDWRDIVRQRGWQLALS
ncbi:Transcriptional activator protein UGA3 [Trichoderma ghanense]|uniref:Transcriptional activator protein UGA3 n=1 Tax=Trichoderma ghanense TaxID=65468 RepID=A0ABY2H4V8_9HYPO